MLRVCAGDGPATVNGSLHASRGGSTAHGKLLALGLLLDEGPRGEYRRRAREALAMARVRALANGLRVFSFEPCALPPNAAALVAGVSAAAACRMGRAVAAQRRACTPGGDACVQPTVTASHPKRMLGSSSSSSGGSGGSGGGGGGGGGGGSSQASSRASSRASSSSGGKGSAPSPQPEACAAVGDDDPHGENATAAALVIDGCCAPTAGRGIGRGGRLKIGRGLKGSGPKRRKQLNYKQKQRRLLTE